MLASPLAVACKPGDDAGDVELFVRVLGPLEVWRNGAVVPIGGPKARLTLAVLLAHRSSVVSTDRLIDALWGNDPPPSAIATIQSNVSRLRKALASDVEIVTRAPGYVLEAPAESVDAARFEDLARAAGGASPQVAVELLEQALALWRGPAFDEFADQDWARGEAVRLEELRLGALESVVEARLALGDLGSVVGELERLVVEHPLRERFWRQLMVALYRSGRQAEALRRANDLRNLLRDELGLDLSPAARELEHRILADDPTLSGDQARPGDSVPDPIAAPATEATRFVGRDDDLEAVGRLLERERLVTLVGPGGVGKTRLAVRLAATSSRGVSAPCVVELAATRDQQAAIQAIAAALDVQQRQHLSLEATLVEFLRDREALVVLDNCEHLVETLAPFVDRLRSSCPGVTVLATSREPLGLSGEQTWQVSPLAVPDVDARSPESVGASEAVQLFIDRACAAHPGFALTAENAAAVAEICRRLDGLPLALELAAARLRSMGPYALAERLRQRSNLLGAAQRGADRRHRTLRDTLEWSYDLLTPSEQQMFARLATFVGSFDLRAAEHICAFDDETRGVADLLANLVDKSMVQVVDLDEPRYRLLETLREFGLERLAHRGERTALRARHVAWYVQVAHDAAVGLTGPDEGEWAARLDRDFDNCREAHAGAVLVGDTESAVSLVASLREFAFRRMRDEVTTWAETTSSMPGIEQHPRSPLVSAVAGYGAFVRGDLETAIQLAEHAVTTAELLGTDSSGLAERTLGNALFYQGHIDVALEWMDRMVASARAAGSPARLAHALYMRSVAATSVGDTQQGSTLATEAVAVAQECNAPTAIAQAAYAAGLALEATSPDEADTHLRRASTIAGSAGNRWLDAFATTEVLWLEARKGNAAGALAGYATVVDTWYRGGDWANQWLSLRHVCGIFALLDANRPAAVLFGSLAAAGAAAALPFEPSDAQRLGNLVEELRRLLGPAEFAAAVRDGAATRDATIVQYVQDQISRLTT
jgi:predicted ATPase/DNA-binding SARP family transcriptional activator